jgi:hypothetical protein
MTSQYKSTENSTSSAGVAIVSLLLTTSSCKFGVLAALCCKFLDKTVWLAFDLVRPILLTALWQTLSPYLFEGSRLVQTLLQAGACLLPLLRLAAC